MQVFSRKSDEKLFGMTANSPAIHHPSTTGGAETENRKQKRKKPAATYPRQAEQKQKSENRKEKSRRRRKRLPSTCIANDAWPVAFSFSVVFLFLFYFSFLFFFSFCKAPMLIINELQRRSCFSKTLATQLPRHYSAVLIPLFRSLSRALLSALHAPLIPTFLTSAFRFLAPPSSHPSPRPLTPFSIRWPKACLSHGESTPFAGWMHNYRRAGRHEWAYTRKRSMARLQAMLQSITRCLRLGKEGKNRSDTSK